MSRIETEVVAVDPKAPGVAAIERAAALIRAGDLVAFPTETVYGLGANALMPKAVASIFEAKGRPAFNPLIVHVPDVDEAKKIVAVWPPIAEILARAFWPGPLSIVLPRRSIVPDEVTGGRSTVAVRVPANPVALALLQACGVPVAAPSANRSEQLSPTTAAHVLAGLGEGRIPFILDGGPTSAGIESTVIAITGAEVRLLRPGPISPGEMERLIGQTVHLPDGKPLDANSEFASPGQMLRHYAPRARLSISDDPDVEVDTLLGAGERVGRLSLAEITSRNVPGLTIVAMPYDPKQYAAALYARLHELDSLGVTRIVVDAPPTDEQWLAIWDRLTRAAT